MFDDTIFGNSEIHPDSFISSRSAVIGRVIVEREVIIAPGCKIRADEGSPFKISHGSNIQDGVSMHGLLNKFVEVNGEKFSIHVGTHCSITHDARLHGPTFIGKKSFIGFDSTIHASKIGRNCYVGFQALVNDCIIGSNCHIGHGAKVIGVDIKNERFIADGLIVNNQQLADALPAITREQYEHDAEFNKEVVDYNKSLVARYKERRLIRDGQWKIFRFLRKYFKAR